MTAPAIDEHDVTVYQGQALDLMREQPDRSVQAIITSPPYYGLRDYGMPGQIGLEPTPADYVHTLAVIFDEARRVLRRDGTLWLNLGDSYSGRANGGQTFDRHRGHGHRAGVIAPQINTTATAPYKSLLGLPWRVAFALIDQGWVLRNEIIWHKPNGMPESVADRLATRHEHLFMFAQSKRYRFNLDAVKVQSTGLPPGNTTADRADRAARADALGERFSGGRTAGGNPGSALLEVHETRNPGDVWSIPTVPFTGAHFATFPPELPRRAILAGTNPGDVVLDPFAGSGTTLMIARRLGRPSVGFELNADTIDQVLRRRLGQSTLDFAGVVGE